MYNVAVTAIIKKEGKILITKRSPNKKRWPSKWTVPGGNLEEKDFVGVPTIINQQHYGVLENCVRREVLEEVGLEIENITYLCDLVTIPNNLIISYIADYKSGEVRLQEEECIEYAWIDLNQINDFDFIDGLEMEFRMVFV